MIEPCEVCGRPASNGITLCLCEECKRLRGRGDIRCSKPNYGARVKALKESWVAGGGRRFICMYSKVPVMTETVDYKHPLYLSLDHKKPGFEDEYIVTCRLINDMKNIMNDREFRKVVVGLAEVFQQEARIETPDLNNELNKIERDFGKKVAGDGGLA